MADNLVVKLGRCRYLGLKTNKWFCGHPLGTKGEIHPTNCTPQCPYYLEAEKFLPRVIREKKVKRKRAFRLENY